jgi:hypothetical protein
MEIQLVGVTDELRKLVDTYNKPPRDTFRRHHTPGLRGGMPPEKVQENELYDAWLVSLKPGDAVYYDYFENWHGGRRFTTVKNRTKTGMIRLADDSLVEQNGRVKGESRYLQPYTEDYRIFDQRKKILYTLNNMKFDHLPNEGLVMILKAVKEAESLLLSLPGLGKDE